MSRWAGIEPGAVELYRLLDEGLRTLFASCPLAAVTVDLAGRVEMWNASAEKMYGWTSEEVLGRPLRTISRDREASFRETLDSAIRGDPTPDFETEQQRRDGCEFLAHVSSLPLKDEYGATRGVLFLLTDISRRRSMEEVLEENQRLEAALAQTHRQLQWITRRMLGAEEEERRRIAGELHDHLNQQLAVLALELGNCRRILPPSMEEARALICVLQERTTALSNDVRRMARNLHPSTLDDLGLVAALRSYCGDLGRRAGVRVRFSAHNVPDGIPGDVGSCLYRIAQEALHNVGRHAGCSRASVSLSFSGSGLRLRVSDDGRGFEPGNIRRRGGLGLLSMADRARLAGGTLEVRSSPGKGTSIEAFVPLAEKLT